MGTPALDIERFVEVMNRNEFIINNVCAHYSNGEYERMVDVSQEVRLWLWSHFGELKVDASLFEEHIWVASRARRVAWNYTRRKRRENTVADLEKCEALISVDPRNEKLLDVLSECLDEDERRMLDDLRNGYTVKEIAAMQDISYEAARSRRRRMIEKMRRYAAKNNML